MHNLKTTEFSSQKTSNADIKSLFSMGSPSRGVEKKLRESGGNPAEKQGRGRERKKKEK
jgi:hypothetical protein